MTAAATPQRTKFNDLAIGESGHDSTANSNSISRHETESGGFLVGYSYQFTNWAGLEGNYGYTRNVQSYSGSFGQSSIQADIHELTGSSLPLGRCLLPKSDSGIPIRAQRLRFTRNTIKK